MTRLHPDDRAFLEALNQKLERVLSLLGSPVPAVKSDEVDGFTEYRIRQMAREDYAREQRRAA